MDIERGCLEIMFNRIPYHEIKYDYLNLAKLDKEIFLKYGQNQFSNYSNDEINNMYYLIVNQKNDVFTFLYNISNILLNTGSKEPTCKYQELLRFHETSHKLGQDLFTTSLLAKQDILSTSNRKYFAWRPVLRTDNKRLQNVLNEGMSENHFHLQGSSQNFMLNWISIMNNINYKGKDLNKLKLRLRLSNREYFSLDNQEEISILDKVILAAYYRCYLFCIIVDNKFLLNDLQKMMDKEMVNLPEIKMEQLRGIIDILRKIYGYCPKGINDYLNVYPFDYCLTKKIGHTNENSNRILAGERYFLYECFKRIYQNKLDERSKLYFWRYILIKNEFRSEMIQVNNNVGFDNFSRYQDRKKIFIDHPILKKELTKLAIAATCQDQKIISLEGRVMVGNSIDTFKKGMKDLSEIAYSEFQKLNKGLFNTDFFVVIHFPKKKDKPLDKHKTPPLLLNPRSFKVREDTKKLAGVLHKYLSEKCEGNFETNTKNIIIKGIDTCSSEIGCRPEVFAQIYRFLLAEGKYVQKHKNSETSIEPLKATYHAGEDFLDIIDGLRAIDEVLLFCAYKRDYRLGHALALGINPWSYYKKKNKKLIMSKQDALDNVVWMMERSVELGLQMDPLLKSDLINRFEDYIGDIYYNALNERKEHQEITCNEYFQAWKLRGDDPYIYESLENGNKPYMHQQKGLGLDQYALNDAIDNCIRMKHRHRELYHRYHFDYSVRLRGEEQVIFDVSDAYIKHVEKLQNLMIHELALKGISIECNPSSNFLIGTFDRYDEHPILRFQPVHKNSNFPSRISASINTDDQGVFDTYLENEYAIMAYSLQKAYEKDSDVNYDVEDIYTWIDSIRKLGIQQKF